MFKILSDEEGLHVHDSIRQHGGPETARRVLVFGFSKEDFFHADADIARRIRDAIDEFLAIGDVDRVLGGGATWTDGDRDRRVYDGQRKS